MSDERDDEKVALQNLSLKLRGAFWRVANNGFSRLMEEAPPAWKGSEARFYRNELRMISEHLEPLYWGSFVTIFLFGTFRVSGSRWYAQIRATHWARKNGSQNTIPTQYRESNFQQLKPPEWKSYLGQRAEKENAHCGEMLQLPTDVLLSILCGMSSILLLSKPSQLRQDFAEAPLLPGKSVVSDCLCDEMDAAFNQLCADPSVLTEEFVKQDDTLLTFLTFVKNCRIRSDYIRAREREGKIRPDVIPYPGLEGARR